MAAQTSDSAASRTPHPVEALLDTNPAGALALLEELDPGAAPAGQRLLWRGRALHATGDLPGALQSLQAAAETLDAQAHPSALAEALLLLGRIQLARGDLDGAHAALRRAHDLAAQGLPDQQATALNQLAAVSHHRGEAAQALKYLHQALEIRVQRGDVTGQVHCLTNIGTQESWLGQYKEALEHLNQAYGLARTLPDDPALVAPILNNLAQVHHMNGDHRLAYEVMGAAYQATAAGHNPQHKAISALNLGAFALEVSELEAARQHLDLALEHSRALGFRMGELNALDSLGILYERTGAAQAAQDAFGAALALALEIGLVQGQVEARLHLGRLHLRAGRLDEAEAHLAEAERLAVQAELPKEHGDAAEALMEVYEGRGDPARALAYAHTLRGLERQRFDSERERQTRQLAILFEVERAHQETRLYQMRTTLAQEAREAAERQVEERTAELARAQHEVVTRLAMAAEYRDDTTGDHTRRVGRAAARIAQALGWPPAQASMLGIAARLHDVGKIGIPDRILLKKGHLTPAEYRQMQQHTLIGGRILSGGSQRCCAWPRRLRARTMNAGTAAAIPWACAARPFR
ncbi:tetratricopeptide repeat protein [Deinococcus multiflagellatus]|uniref:Tetratricopeptide repeat protein n=1 Tax=Deinococcus multiflagellatus TaxID=1656887 RepID=A0ABW1ZFD4_9DEIO